MSRRRKRTRSRNPRKPSEPPWEDLPAALKEAYCVFDLWRKLGYPAAEIFFRTGILDGNVLVEMVLFHDRLNFTISCGVIADSTCEDAEKRWIEFVTALNAKEIPQQTLSQWWDASLAKREAMAIIVAMKLKEQHESGAPMQ